MPAPCITLLTDFGTRDGYVGAMKGVLVAGAPGVPIVELTHDIEVGAVAQGAFVLRASVGTFPAGTIHVAVVDPGVGTERNALLVERSDGTLFVGPDNGLLSLAAPAPRRIHRLDKPRWFRLDPAATFHGRDVFAPVAAAAAAGTAPAELGTPIEKMVEISLPAVRRRGNAVEGEVIHIDHFGNLITNISMGEMLMIGRPETLVVSIGGRSIVGVQETYGHSPPGVLVSVVGSTGLVEVAVVSGSAERLIGGQARCGLPVRIDGGGV